MYYQKKILTQLLKFFYPDEKISTQSKAKNIAHENASEEISQEGPTDAPHQGGSKAVRL